MLIATKITRKNKLILYGLLSFLIFGASILAIYRYYIENLELTASNVATPAVLASLQAQESFEDQKIDQETSQEDQETSQEDEETAKVKEFFDLSIFKNPKFKSLRENAAPALNLETGTKNPFAPKESPIVERTKTVEQITF